MPEVPATEAVTCAALSGALAEPLPGTAAVAGTWLCVEQRGPWGRDALRESHLDPAVGHALAERAEDSGVRVQLIRRPGRHADTESTARRVHLAHTHPGGSWLRTAEMSDPRELLDLDLDLFAQGEHGGWGRADSGPLLLVCTNGRRDRCCAVLGRDLATHLAPEHGDVVWETTHTGGHRFAPAAVLLPSGYTYGRITTSDAGGLLAAAASGELATRGCRGRSTWHSAGQVAELALRERIGDYELDAVRVIGDQDDQVRVLHRDGRGWTVTVQRRDLDPPRPNSCGKAAGRPVSFHVTGIVATT